MDFHCTGLQFSTSSRVNTDGYSTRQIYFSFRYEQDSIEATHRTSTAFNRNSITLCNIFWHII